MDLIVNGSIIVEAKRPTGWQQPGPADIPFSVPGTCQGCGSYVQFLAAIGDAEPRCADCIIDKLRSEGR